MKDIVKYLSLFFNYSYLISILITLSHYRVIKVFQNQVMEIEPNQESMLSCNWCQPIKIFVPLKNNL